MGTISDLLNKPKAKPTPQKEPIYRPEKEPGGMDIKPKKGGRPKKHGSQAEKQKAYRDRKKDNV